MTSRVLGVVQIVIAAAAVLAAMAGLTRELPVTAMLAATPVPIATVSLSAAVAVLAAGVAVARFGPPRWRAIERSQVAGVTVFLVAQLNGITEVTSLVPLYALASGATLLLVVMERDRAADRPARLPFAVGAAIGIVPWGVVAFQQIGSLIVGADPDPVVRVLTLVALALTAGQWAAEWRGMSRPTAPLTTVSLTTALLTTALTVTLLLAAILPVA